MDVNLVPSLQHFTLTKIAIALCNSDEIKALLEENRTPYSCDSHGLYTIQGNNFLPIFGRSEHYLYANDERPMRLINVDNDMLEKIQGRVRCMISPLCIGRSLEKKVLSFIPHIVLEIEKWEEDHSEALPPGFGTKGYFCWKSVGIIDRERTTEHLLNRGTLSVKNQFRLACLYCLQNHLSSLWDSIRDSHKAHLISKCHRGSLLNYWTTRLDGLHSRKFVFPDASCIINVSALQYFYNECPKDKRRSFLNDVLSKQCKNSDLAHFCIFELSRNGPEELSSSECHNVLKSFLNWPFQDSFSTVSDGLLVKLDQVEIHKLLCDILRLINTHRYDTYYLDLLKEFWVQVPFCHKDYLMETPDFQLIKSALEEASASHLLFNGPSACNVKYVDT